MAKRTTTRASRQTPPSAVPVAERVAAILAALEMRSSKKDFANFARFGITTDKAFGTSVTTLRAIAKPYGRDHALAAALWKTGWYEARMMAAFVDEPASVTPAQMDRCCRAFDNWAICDTHCFHLYDRTPHAWAAVERWASWRGEFERRAAFALLASLALHDKACPDEPFLLSLPLIEAASDDPRNFVKKAVNWALRGIGRRRSPALARAALSTAKRLADSGDATARWIGKDAARYLDKR